MEATPQHTLDLVRAGASAVVRGVEGEDALAGRLRDLGFWPGTAVEVVRQALFGGPVEYRLRGYRIALRRNEAARIVVTSRAE